MQQARFLSSLALSAALHLLLGLLLYLDVVGPGGGLGIGSGPGAGVGQGGGAGLGKGRKRQIYALDEVRTEPARPRRGRVEDLLAAVADPQVAVRAPIALVGDLAVGVPKSVALPLPAAAPRSDLAAAGSAGAVVIGGLGGAGGGGGFGVSLGGAFGRYVSDLRARGLDVVFVVDGTASMGHVIERVRRELEGLVGTLQGLVPVARIGFVVYRDRGDAVPVEVAPLTASRKKLDEFLGRVRAQGGGDWPESLNLGLEAALERMAWREDAKRILVVVASSPPHDDERQATIDVARRLASEGGTVSAVDLSRAMHEEYLRAVAQGTPEREPTPQELATLPGFYEEVRGAFREVVAAGGGELVELERGDALVEHLLVVAFGTRWKQELERLARLPRAKD